VRHQQWAAVHPFAVHPFAVHPFAVHPFAAPPLAGVVLVAAGVVWGVAVLESCAV
jgi:hypothetical protein